MGMGGIIAGAMGGLGQGMANLGKMEMEAEQTAQRDKTLAQLREQILQDRENAIEAKRVRHSAAFGAALERQQTAKLGADAGNLDQAAETYRSAEGLSDGDRTAGLQAVEDAKARLGKLSAQEVARAGVESATLDPQDYIGLMARGEARDDKAANTLALRELIEGRKDARQERGIESRERIATERATHGGELSTAQRMRNKEIDVARQKIAGLSPDDIRRKTAKFTNTGRDNPDYDADLARRVTLAAKRKYGDDDWFDGQGEAGQPTSPASADDTASRFAADKDMHGLKLGPKTPDGYEVRDSGGKLLGHYY